MGHKYIAKTPDKNGFVEYAHEEHETWGILLERQKEIVKNRACDEFIQGLEILEFSPKKIPQAPEISAILNDHTGWGVQPVPALIPAEEFFGLLANKKFPVASFIRIREELDYLQEPDVFHELFGHCPLLTNKPYAHFMHEYGKLALTCDHKTRMTLFRLFWFTIEFGLLKTEKGNRIYGGGILSSREETVYSLESEIPERIEFDPLTALRTPFRIDIIQPLYFVLKSLDDLFKLFDQDLIKLVNEAKSLGSFPPKFEPKNREVEICC